MRRSARRPPCSTGPPGVPPRPVAARTSGWSAAAPAPAGWASGISSPFSARCRLVANSAVTLAACRATTFWPTLPSAPASTRSPSTSTLVPSAVPLSRTVFSARRLPIAPRTLLPAARNRISSSVTRSRTVTFASNVAVIGPRLWVARIWTLSSSSTVTCSTPGRQPATDSGSSKNFQTALTGSVTVNSWYIFMSGPFLGRLARPVPRAARAAQLGEHPPHIDGNQVAPVVRGRPHIGRRVGHLQRGLGGCGDDLIGQL